MANLRNIRLLQNCRADEIEHLQNTLRETTFQSGDPVFREGDPGDGMYFVLSGRVEIAARMADGKARPLGRVSAGDFFGEMALIDGQPRSASARAVTGVVALFWPAQRFDEALERFPRLGNVLLREFSRRIREFDHAYLREIMEAERLAMLGRFARTILHDLKNPLSTIGLAGELLGNDRISREQRNSYLERIHRNVNRIQSMVQELIDFTRGAASQGEAEWMQFDDWWGRFLTRLQGDLNDAHWQVHCRSAPPPWRLRLDGDKMTRALRNLVNNAIEAREGAGNIWFDFETDDGNVRLRIEDDGPGVPAAIAETLFDPFVTHGKARGSGLGLAICRRFIQDHGGEIHLDSTPGRGARFIISLPRPI